MKKLSTKLVAIFLAVMMVATSAPFSAMAATSAPKSALTELSDEISAYRDKMNGQNVYTNMAAAYNAYIAAVQVYDKAKYGAADVSETDITNAKNTLATASANMGTWTPYTGTARPNSSTKGFSDDSNTNTTVNSNPSGYATGWRPFADATGNKYVDDIYSSTYQNLGYVQTAVSSTSATWEQSNCAFSIYIPNAVVIYDGSNGFKARVGVMADYHSTGRKARKVAQIMVNGNDYLAFGDNWLQNAKDDGDTNFGVKSRYENRDFIGAIGRPSPTDRASGNATADSTGTRQSKNGLFSSTGPTYYLGNYMEFTVPSSATAFNTNTAASYSITSLPVQSKSGDTTFNDTWNGNVTVKIDVLNYKLLINKVNAAKQSLRITESNPYLEGGLSALITAVNNAMTWNPNGQSNISTLVTNMNNRINAITNAAVTADDSPYGSLATKMDSVLATSGTLGEWYNVNNKTDNYTDESIQAFVKAFTYAQSIFDQNSNFADSYSFSASTVTVGTGDDAVTVTVPAATKTVTEVYNELVAARLIATERVNVETLTMYIEELTTALKYADVFGIKGSNTETNILDAVENAKYRIWGQSTITDEETGETYTVLNYPDEGSLPKASTTNQNRVTQQENALRPYIEALAVNTRVNVVYNDTTGAQNNLSRITSDMSDTNVYPRGDYINADTLDEGVNYVNNNFIAAVVPNANTQIREGIVQDKVDEYKSMIQYCQDVIDALEKTFLALDNGTMINMGSMEVLTPNQIEDKWKTDFARYNNQVVFRTTKLQSNLNLGSASLSFYEADTSAWGSDVEYRTVLDSINLNDTAGASNSIHKANAISFSELPSVAMSEEECAQYPGKLSVSTTNGGTYGVANFVGVRGYSDGAGSYQFGKAGEDGSLTSGLAVTDGTQSAASGIWAFPQTTTLVAGNAYLSLPEEAAVTLTRNTTPKSTVYSFTGYFGTVFYWMADGAGVSLVKNVYNGYYHERTSNTYTQSTTVIDISNLKDLVTTVNTLNKNDYTEASWNNMKNKLAAATSNDFGSGNSYRDLTTANLTSALVTRYQNLYDAWKALIPAATNIELTRPVAQAQNEGKDIGAVVKANDNVNYTKYNTNNDVTAANPYGTYTTNTWNDFKAAYEAGDVAIFGDGTNAGIYATPTYDTDGNTVVVGTRGYARFLSSDGDALTLADLDALGLTIDDIEAVEQASGVSLSTEQAAINQLAANINAKYAALKKWANFAPINSAMTALGNVFTSDYDKKYTTESLNAINSAFAAAPITTNKYYQIANDAAAQHALVNGVAKYNEDNDAAISTEADAITAVIPPTESNVEQDNYTADAVIALVDAEMSDPDAKDVTVARQEAQALANTLYTTVNIAPLSSKPVIGVNYVENSELDSQIATILTHIETITYDVTVKDEKGNVIQTLADQPYGTEIHLEQPDGKPVEWTYTYQSRTVKNHKPLKTGAVESFDFVVVGDTTITRGEYYTDGTAEKGFKVVFNDNLNHVYDVEYVSAGATYTYDEANGKVILTNNGESMEIAAPKYPFYTFTGYERATDEAVEITKDTVIMAMYEADEDADTFVLTVYNADRDASAELDVLYNSKVKVDETAIVETRVKAKTVPGVMNIDGEDVNVPGAGVSRGGELYGMTIVEGEDFETWSEARANYDTSIQGTEVPFTVDKAGDYVFHPDSNCIIVIYESETTYEEAMNSGFVTATAKTSVRQGLVVTDEKFTMHGRVYSPDGMDSIVECGILAYVGHNSDEIAVEDLNLSTYTTLGANRFKSTTYKDYGNMNISIPTANLKGKTLRVRYRAYLTYKTTEGGKTVTKTVYSKTMGDDTWKM